MSRRGTYNLQGGAIYASSANVELVQVTFFVNIPAGSIAGGEYTIKYYAGFFPNPTSKSCGQCAVGTYKSGTNGLNTCSDCPEGRYGLSGSAQSNISHCPKCPSGYYGPTMRTITW